MRLSHRTTNLKSINAAIWAVCLSGTICAAITYVFLKLSIGIGGTSFHLVSMLKFFSYVEPAEKFFFFSYFFLGSLAAYLAARFLSPNSQFLRMLWLKTICFITAFQPCHGWDIQ